jgi:hypothetical protein
MNTVEVVVQGESIGALATPFSMGRDPECDVILPDSSVSRRHVRVTALEGTLSVEDMGSSNGTFVDGQRITGPTDIGEDRSFMVGRVDVRLRAVQGDDVKGYQSPRDAARAQASRHQTLSVDIPDDLMGEPVNLPPMRTFDCPACSARLRAPSTSRRAQCRQCSTIIRFEGETPVLDSREAPPTRDNLSEPASQAAEQAAGQAAEQSAPVNPPAAKSMQPDPSEPWEAAPRSNPKSADWSDLETGHPSENSEGFIGALEDMVSARTLTTAGAALAGASSVAVFMGFLNWLALVIIGCALALAGMIRETRDEVRMFGNDDPIDGLRHHIDDLAKDGLLGPEDHANISTIIEHADTHQHPQG